ncbi:DUF7344 domain-containing protein [Haloarcula laminariae]|uniref:DUF7344 domain-containing protein n=1 Tax=Haloarcula laminariae TaxID=2961577 RepID=UPI0021C5E131|nr:MULTISPECIES: hypothetical protein [Halomicroarcula]
MLSKPPLADDAGNPFDLLGSRRRRVLLARVSEADGAVPLDWLAGQLAADGAEQSTEAVTESERERAKVRLHHVDIPPLSAAGLVRYDPQRRVVSSDDLPLEGQEWLDMPVVEALEDWNGR